MTEELKHCPCREAFEKWANEQCDDRGILMIADAIEERLWKKWQAAWNTRHGEK